MPLPDRRLAALAGVLALSLTAACVRPNPPGVKVASLQADIVFGVKQAKHDTTPPASITPVSDDGADVGEPDVFAPFGRRFSDIPTLPDECPLASQDDFPDKSATYGIEGLPPVGLYRWKQAGSVLNSRLTGIITVGGFQERLITNVSPVTRTTYPADPADPANGKTLTTETFTFDEIRPLGDGYVQLTYQVKSGALDLKLPITVPLVGYISNTQVGEADRGVSLLQELHRDSSGNVVTGTTRTFNPPVLLLPIEVSPGEQYRSVGVARETGATLVHQATVVNRQFIDACGKEVDGWRVDATQTFTEPQTNKTVSSSYSYVIATQLGGMMIYEHIGPPPATMAQPQGPLGQVPVFPPNPQAPGAIPSPNAAFQLGQAKPTPAPSDLRIPTE